ncbi:hypothetical protein ACUXZZ_20710 [Streptomyces graminifolii]|uniref:hypothetical protein n=1 Tax=Streptomyces graminifolii TaxID=1266771 RepID=UPI00405A39EA
MTAPALPSALDLTRPQFDGWACVWCGVPLMGMAGVTSAGRAEGQIGAHDLGVEVYACAPCTVAPLTPAERARALRGRREGDRSALGGEARS